MCLINRKTKKSEYNKVASQITQYTNAAIDSYLREKEIERSNVRYSLKETDVVKHSRKETDVVHKPIDVDNYLLWENKNAILKSFSHKVIDYMNAKSLTATKLYKKAQIDRKLFSKLKTDYCYQPTKITAIKICLGLDLTCSEAEDLLQAAGYSLSKNIPFDLAIRFCLENNYTNIDDVNEVLYQLSEKTL